MKKYKALMLDVDGTLSPYSSTQLPIMPSEKIIKAIEVAQEIVYVGLATSRPLVKVKPILENLMLNGFSILHNGAQIVNSSTLDTVWKKAIAQESLSQLYALGRRYHVQTYFSDFQQNNPVESLEQLVRNPVGDIFFDGIDDGNIEAFANELAELPAIAVHKLSSRWENKFEISVTSIEATKQSAIIEVARLLGIRTEEIIGVGDGYNDISLLTACGLKVAMGNAVEELKAIADFIAPSIEEDGVAVVIKEFILR